MSRPRRDAFSVNFGFAAGVSHTHKGIKTLNRMVTLKASPTNFICDEETLEQEAEERSFEVPGQIFRQAVALAEASSSFRAPARHFQLGQGKSFAEALTRALQQEMTPAPPRRLSAQTSLDQLHAFFNVPINRRWLTKIAAFVSKNNGFSLS